jgi:hypothetical protein
MVRKGAGGLDQSRKARPLDGWWRSGKPRQSHGDFLMFEKEMRAIYIAFPLVELKIFLKFFLKSLSCFRSLF